MRWFWHTWPYLHNYWGAIGGLATVGVAWKCMNWIARWRSDKATEKIKLALLGANLIGKSEEELLSETGLKRKRLIKELYRVRPSQLFGKGTDGRWRIGSTSPNSSSRLRSRF